MITINEHYRKLRASYLFSDIGKRVAEFKVKNPEKEIIKFGIGDVTRPLPQVCIEAFHKATDEMASESSFRGYGDEQGYAFLREKIAHFDFQSRGADIMADEIFVSDGSKCDTGNFQELFSQNIAVAVPDPVYPVYVDTNVMAGRTREFTEGRYGGLIYLECTARNGFVPDLPKEKPDLIYLCFPNNPTGATITLDRLKEWVDFARQSKSLILFDAAYVAYIRDASLPQSIFEIEGARDVAVEFRSFSKTAGFTGTRCAFTVIPNELVAYDSKGNPVQVKPLWMRRHTTKFNGVSYPVQKAAAAIYSEEGKKEVKGLISYYLENARIIRESLSVLGYTIFGGINAPYVWAKTKNNLTSWEFFDKLLHDANVVGTPGSGFGPSGEGYFRFSAFADRENVIKAMERIKNLSF